MPEDKIKTTVPSFRNPIQKLLIDVNGTVGKLDENGTWTIIYRGPGNNLNGLWFN